MKNSVTRQNIAQERAAEISAYLAREPKTDDEAAFDFLARRLFAYQYEWNAPYRTYCDGLGAAPDTVTGWRTVPAVPAAAFKTVALTCAPEAECEPERGGAVFHSSGTTRGETSRHFLDADAADLYRASLRAGYQQFVTPDVAMRGAAPLSVYALMPSPNDAPHSSLSFMLGELIKTDGGQFFDWNDGWQKRLARALRDLSGPVTLFGTAFAWVHFLDWLAETGEPSFALPFSPDSRIVETGGFKGRSREVSRDELYQLFTDRLGVPDIYRLSEYGMSEMASQFYDSHLLDRITGAKRPSRKVGPHWLRTRVIDPITGEEAPRGEPGLLVHYDLANLNSVFAIQTEDWGYAHPDGDGFVLQGRAPGAVLRGCSLAAEELSARVSAA